jgi:peptide-methionine (S)-S-oxide reductase
MIKHAVFGGGCFWCTEAVFQQLKGVQAVESGYAGGHDPHPTYESVCSGRTGHAEVIKVTYDDAVVGYDTLLEIFFTAHDPTTLNRQGNDVGTQYRSIILYEDDAQRDAANAAIRRLDASGAFDAKIVTTVEPLKAYFPAEAYHQDFYDRNPAQPYCAFMIPPKLEKLRKAFRDRLKGDD